MFADTASLQVLIARGCNQALPFVSDPITDLACSMIRAPLEVCVSLQGVQMFKEKPDIVLPFACMRPEQRAFLHDMLANSHQLHTLAVRNNCVCVKFASATTKPRRLSVRDVLSAVVKAIMQGQAVSVINETIRTSLCNLVLQRIGSAVHISHENFVFLFQYMREMRAEDAADNLSATHPADTTHVDRKCAAVRNECQGSAKRSSLGRGKKRALEELVVAD